MAEEIDVRLYDLREKVRKGEDVSPDEYAELLDDLRENRRTAATTKKSEKASKPSNLPANLNDLFTKPVVEAEQTKS